MFIKKLKFAWEYFILGRHRLPKIEAPSDFDYPTPDPILTEFLVGMYRDHGASVKVVGNWVCVDRGRLFTRASFFYHSQNQENHCLQIDFITITSSGQHISESFAGIGPNTIEALKDACKSYQDSTFHVLFATLLERQCEHVEKDIWRIGGKSRQMTFGLLRMRGQLPLDEWPPVFQGIQRQVEGLDLGPGLHWARYFYCHLPSENPTIEVLIDNCPHERLQSLVPELPWPKTTDFYTARLFFVIQDQ